MTILKITFTAFIVVVVWFTILTWVSQSEPSPGVVNDFATIEISERKSIDVLANDVASADGFDVSTLRLVGQGEPSPSLQLSLTDMYNLPTGSVFVHDGQIEYVSSQHVVSPIYITYEICDFDNLCQVAVLTIEVTPKSE